MSARPGVARREMAPITCAHAVIDACHGAMAALLPFLISAHGWSYGTAAALITAGSLTTVVVQPVLGHVADRRPMPQLMPAGLLIGTAGIGCMAVAPTFPLALVSATIAGVGLGAFHPEGSRYASYASGRRRATGMSIFSVGGNAGLALGPIVIAPAVAVLGLRGAFVLVLPGLLVAAWLTSELPRLARARSRALQDRQAYAGTSRASDNWSAFSRLTLVVAIRALAFFGFLTFIPLYLVEVIHTSATTGNWGLTIYLVGGALGTLVGGRLADRTGRRAVIVGALSLTTPLTLGMLALTTTAAIPVLFFIGLTIVGSFSITVVLGQEYLPSHMGVASGVIFGVSGGLGSVGTPLLGLIGDAYGIKATLLIVALLPLIGVAAALTLPVPRRRPR